MRKDTDRSKVVPMASPAPSANRLPYTVELWNMPRTEPERIIGRAASAGLARAIYTAAQSEHLGRRVLLKRGAQVLAESG